MREQYTTPLDPWTLQQARRVAKAQDTTVAALIDEGIMLAVARYDEEQIRAAGVPSLPSDTDADLLRAADQKRSARGVA